MNGTATTPNSGSDAKSVPNETQAARPSLAPGRVLLFVGVIVSLTLGATWLVLETWNSFQGSISFPGWQLMFPVMTVGFVLLTIIGMRTTHPLLRAGYWVCAVWLGILSLFFFGSVLCWFAYLTVLALELPVPAAVIVESVFGIALALGVYGLLNAKRIRITRMNVCLARLPENWKDRTVALVSDLHLGQVHGVRLVRKIVAELNTLKPDAVLISGDMFDGLKVDAAALLEPWRRLAAPLGACFVTGNHDEFQDRNECLRAIQAIGIRVLNNERIDLDGLSVIGVHDFESTHESKLRGILGSLDLDRSATHLLLTHQPGAASAAAEAGVALQLSGHTHGGQMWPWTLVGRMVHGALNHGLSRVGEMQVITSSGAGTWGPPFRLGTKSEIVLIHFKPSTRTTS